MPESTIQSIYAVGGQEGERTLPELSEAGQRGHLAGSWREETGEQEQRLGFGQRPMSREAAGWLGDLGVHRDPWA